MPPSVKPSGFAAPCVGRCAQLAQPKKQPAVMANNFNPMNTQNTASAPAIGAQWQISETHRKGELVIVESAGRDIGGKELHCGVAAVCVSRSIHDKGPSAREWERARLIAAAPTMLEALQEIAKGEGAFSRDQLKHAANVIDNSIALARAAIAKAQGAGVATTGTGSA